MYAFLFSSTSFNVSVTALEELSIKNLPKKIAYFDGEKVDLAGQFFERISEYVESEISVTAMAIEADGDGMIMAAYPLSLNDHYYHAENNECYHVLERFTTRSGANFIYSRDEELDADYLVKV